MVGMQIAEAQLAAKRAWYMQCARCVLTGLVLIFVIFEEHRRIVGPLWTLNGFAAIWSVFAIILTGYMTEQTWHAWRQLQFARNLTHALTSFEFERAKAQEKWHNAVRDLLLFAAVFVLISLMLHGNASVSLTPFLLFALIPAVVRINRSRRKLRRVSS